MAANVFARQFDVAGQIHPGGGVCGAGALAQRLMAIQLFDGGKMAEPAAAPRATGCGSAHAIQAVHAAQAAASARPRAAAFFQRMKAPAQDVRWTLTPSGPCS